MGRAEGGCAAFAFVQHAADLAEAEGLKPEHIRQKGRPLRIGIERGRAQDSPTSG